jgi:beta-glucanase (GH16 family)
MFSSNKKLLLWSEEFPPTPNGQPNPEFWTPDLGDGSQYGLVGWGNNEREFYTTESLVANNGLTITAAREKDQSSYEAYYGPAEWTSGKIHSNGKVFFKYGFLEISAKMPKGVGTWPALWLLGKSISDGTPWPACGEIDLFEGNGAKPKTIQGTLHAMGYAGEFGITGFHESSSDMSEDFNRFAIHWKEDSIEWFFNDRSYQKFNRDKDDFADKEWPFNDYFYLIINQAIGGWFVGEVDPQLQSSKLEVKYIKHYQIDGVGEVLKINA